MPLEQLLRVGSAQPITRWDDPVMHRPTRPVTDFGPDLWNLLATMFATNRAARGAGLAATQVGVDLSVFVYDTVDADFRRHVGLFCNPRIEVPADAPRTLDTDLEGCLSLPGANSPLGRPGHVVCHGQDQFGQDISVTGTGWLARCLQHETDHLNGMVMEDRLSAKARKAHRRQHAALAGQYPASWPVPASPAS